jgi:hypothetical protein
VSTTRWMSELRRATCVAIAVAAAACASAPSATEQQRSVINANRDVYRQTDNGIAASFDAPHDAVWKAVVGAYSDIGILPDAADTSIWAVSRSKLVMRNVYKGTRVSRLFSCGETPTGSAQADNGQIIATIRSQLANAAPTTRVETLVDAWLIPDGGTSSNSLHCGSTGILEAQLNKAIAARLGQPAAGS